jgi:hypothetical protein
MVAARLIAFFSFRHRKLQQYFTQFLSPFSITCPFSSKALQQVTPQSMCMLFKQCFGDNNEQGFSSFGLSDMTT